MVNDYQRQFLRHLASCCVRFIVVGGQARVWADPTVSTRDLDVWVDIEGPAHDTTRAALAAWVERHPAHTSGQLATIIERKKQLKLPDVGAMYIDDHGHPAEISSTDGVDVLTSIGDTAFDIAHRRAASIVMDGVSLRYLATTK